LFTSGGLGLVILVLVLRIWYCLHHRLKAPYFRPANVGSSPAVNPYDSLTLSGRAPGLNCFRAPE